MGCTDDQCHLFLEHFLCSFDIWICCELGLDAWSRSTMGVSKFRQTNAQWGIIKFAAS